MIGFNLSVRTCGVVRQPLQALQALENGVPAPVRAFSAAAGAVAGGKKDPSRAMAPPPTWWKNETTWKDIGGLPRGHVLRLENTKLGEAKKFAALDKDAVIKEWTRQVKPKMVSEPAWLKMSTSQQRMLLAEANVERKVLDDKTCSKMRGEVLTDSEMRELNRSYRKRSELSHVLPKDIDITKMTEEQVAERHTATKVERKLHRAKQICKNVPAGDVAKLTDEELVALAKVEKRRRILQQEGEPAENYSATEVVEKYQKLGKKSVSI